MNSIKAGILVALLATGCATHEHKLNPLNDSEHAVAGRLEHGNIGSPDRLVLESKGKRFEGELDVKSHLNWQGIRKAYGSDSKHWNRIKSGLDKDHQIYVGTGAIKSADGDVMQCRLIWTRSDRPYGECADIAGSRHPLNFE